jgi:plastocyanin
VLRVRADDTQDFDADAYLASAGDVTVEYVQSGFQNHTLVIEGLEDQMRLEVENGGRDSGTVTLQPGRYIIYCDVAGHRDGGMEARLLVE